MKLLHTSDWHIGRALYGRKRYPEFQAFLAWLIETLNQQQIDVLLVAGDVFDTNTPSNRAQELYYEFLCQVAASYCRHVVIIGGNHDSPSFLEAPKSLLKALNVYVVGAKCDDIADEVIVLRDHQQQPQAIICAVPYLRDKDIRSQEAGESIDDKNRKLVTGIKQHYEAVCDQAQAMRESWSDQWLPIIGMGHLFAAGGKTLDGDGVRELYVGTLAHVSVDIFPACLDYVALGHLHVPQTVGGKEHIRYSGSPIPMGFGEANQVKQVVVVDMSAGKPDIQTIEVPRWQQLVRLKGDQQAILQGVAGLQHQDSQAWLEIEFTGSESINQLRESLSQLTAESELEVLRIKNTRAMARIMRQIDDSETLDDLDTHDVFQRCLDAHQIPTEQQQELRYCYKTILQHLHETDHNAE